MQHAKLHDYPRDIPSNLEFIVLSRRDLLRRHLRILLVIEHSEMIVMQTHLLPVDGVGGQGNAGSARSAGQLQGCLGCLAPELQCLQPESPSRVQ